jgi:L-lactate dehydrogenase complex protein LldG
MNSREKILAAVLNNQPASTELPNDLSFVQIDQEQVVNKFVEVITAIGGTVLPIDDLSDINAYVTATFNATDELITFVPELAHYPKFTGLEKPHQFVSTEFALFEPHFAVAENGAVWLTEDRMGHRVLPFICQHLGMLVRKESIVANMHEAYQLIEAQQYSFGTFIAGPSKTADIEQSLVLGAHGARSMMIFLI